MLDELILGGEVQETSKNVILKAIAQQDLVQEVSIVAFFQVCTHCRGVPRNKIIT